MSRLHFKDTVSVSLESSETVFHVVAYYRDPSVSSSKRNLYHGSIFGHVTCPSQSRRRMPSPVRYSNSPIGVIAQQRRTRWDLLILIHAVPIDLQSPRIQIIGGQWRADVLQPECHRHFERMVNLRRQPTAVI